MLLPRGTIVAPGMVVFAPVGSSCCPGGQLLPRGQLLLPRGQLEARMKLWWPQLEAMVALLTAFAHTRRPQYLRRFHRVAQYAWSRVRHACVPCHTCA